MKRELESRKRLFPAVSPKELVSSLDCAFNELVTSEIYTHFKHTDRIRLVLDWQWIRRYLEALE